MIKLNVISGFFLACTLIVACGELHRVVASDSSDVEPLPADNTPALSPSPTPIAVHSIGFLFPVPGKSRKHLIGRFGEPRGGGTRVHEGVDIAAKRGTAVVAVTSGKITKVKEGGNGGKQVWMEDDEGHRLYYYAHLHEQLVNVGQEVEKGTVLGTVGNTGNASKGSPHLHFGIYEPGFKAVDPLTLLP